MERINNGLINANIKLVDENKELKQEIERLNNIINEFDKWLKEMKKYYGVGYYDTTINKLQELKRK